LYCFPFDFGKEQYKENSSIGEDEGVDHEFGVFTREFDPFTREFRDFTQELESLLVNLCVLLVNFGLLLVSFELFLVSFELLLVNLCVSRKFPSLFAAFSREFLSLLLAKQHTCCLYIVFLPCSRTD
ncbi:hypothetical protein ACIROD_04985, partial [Peribacillus sp. NPDC101481]|uniref:hypothetical protein n=1 Tax=Peribacillus sp. NPDC101481 TaxID=3364403 RepID=UPI003807FCC3